MLASQQATKAGRPGASRNPRVHVHMTTTGLWSTSLILLQHEEQLHSRHDSRLTTAPEPVPASTHSLAPVVSVATFSPGRQKVSYNLKRPRHDTQASRPPACPESPILFCWAAFALGLHCSVLSAQCSLLARTCCGVWILLPKLSTFNP